MAKILKNTTGSSISIMDTGVSIPASPGSYTIPVQDYLLWAASSNVITKIGDGGVVVNDGSFDLSISDGTDLIKGLFPNKMRVLAGDGTEIGHNGDKLKVDATAVVDLNASTGFTHVNRVDVNNSVITSNGQTSSFDTLGYGCISFIIETSSVSGTNPTLQAELEASDDNTNWNQVHSTRRFLNGGVQRISGIRLLAKYYRFRYLVGGTSPSFTVKITSTLKSYSPGRTGSQFRYGDVDLTTSNSTSTVYNAFSNENISLCIARSADAGSGAGIIIQGSNDTLNWFDLTSNINITANQKLLQTFTGYALRFYRVKVNNSTSQGTLDLFWNSNGGGA